MRALLPAARIFFARDSVLFSKWIWRLNTGMIPLFRFPTFKKTNFARHFKVERVDKPQFQQLTNVREKLRAMLKKSPTVAQTDSIIACIDEYLPHILSLHTWVKESGVAKEEAETRKDIREAERAEKNAAEYMWHPPCSDRLGTYDSDDVTFEVVMVLATKAAMLFNRASLDAPRLLEHGSESYKADAQRVAGYYRAAAGLWDLIETEWVMQFPPDAKHSAPEANPTFCNAMSALCVGLAQFVIFLSARYRMTDPETGEKLPPMAPPSACARLAAAVIERVDCARFTLESCTDIRRHIDDNIRKFTLALPPVVTAMANASMADARWGLKQYGEAVAAARVAAARIAEAPSVRKKPGPVWQSFMARTRSEIEGKLKTYQHENNFIFRQTIPKLDEIPLPDPQLIAKPTAAALPEPLWRTLLSKK
eukprot:gnl/Chilomastix_cuspidata/448.p2 GENE.gnl/Chilomastix_cuspidata/448~~gnl/Chilomastix_cuspidata/448.p2  ORF type:complete len:423 (+),score=206.38 gnl/Chilomastix_cuspidata/448:115-1383(+)